MPTLDANSGQRTLYVIVHEDWLRPAAADPAVHALLQEIEGVKGRARGFSRESHLWILPGSTEWYAEVLYSPSNLPSMLPEPQANLEVVVLGGMEECNALQADALQRAGYAVRQGMRIAHAEK